MIYLLLFNFLKRFYQLVAFGMVLILKIRSDMPIILCTGFNEKNDEGKAKAIGILDILKSHTKKNDLAIIVCQVLGGK